MNAKERNAEEIKGRIHSVESFGTVDGPGVRFVIFFQGCPMRCLYCHNPDTWAVNKGREMSVEELLSMYEKNRSYYKKGGITATGGEPLMQMKFLTLLFQKAKEQGIHTCLDTSGSPYREKEKTSYIELLQYTDLVLLDFKHSNETEHKKLTAQSQKAVLEFAELLEMEKIPMIARHVIVPGITDGEEHLRKLGRMIGKFKNLEGLEVLPYHTMGAVKYESLGAEYPLKGIESLEKEKAEELKNIIVKEILQVYNK